MRNKARGTQYSQDIPISGKDTQAPMNPHVLDTGTSMNLYWTLVLPPIFVGHQ
jgi:hypothetical protein